jgi:hypothetical protein
MSKIDGKTFSDATNLVLAVRLGEIKGYENGPTIEELRKILEKTSPELAKLSNKELLDLSEKHTQTIHCARYLTDKKKSLLTFRTFDGTHGLEYKGSDELLVMRGLIEKTGPSYKIKVDI